MRKFNPRLVPLVGLLLAAVFLVSASSSGQAAEKLRLLIVDGQNNHNWAVMTPYMTQVLEETGRFDVDVATTPPAGRPESEWDVFRPRFSDYDVVLSNYNGQAWPTETQAALVAYIKEGGGLVNIHAANNAFPEWPEFNEMIGLGWRGADYGDRISLDDSGKVVRSPAGKGPGAGHGRQHEFTVVSRDVDHPVMKGLRREWMHTKDELYHGQRGPALNMQILATAYSDKATGGTGAHEPMVWVIPFGKGRVFTTVLGHVNGGGTDITSLRCHGFQAIMTRGCEWAATGKVTLPAPENFPKADAVSVDPAK